MGICTEGSERLDREDQEDLIEKVLLDMAMLTGSNAAYGFLTCKRNEENMATKIDPIVEFRQDHRKVRDLF